MKNRLIVAVQITEQANRFRVVKKKKKWILLPFFLYSFLTLIHFYIVYKGSGDVLPLVYDYGLGSVLALAFNVYLFRNWHLSICDDGIIVGSRLDAKLITWEYIDKIEYTPVSIIISISSKHPIHKIELSNFKQVQLFEKLLKYKMS